MVAALCCCLPALERCYYKFRLVIKMYDGGSGARDTTFTRVRNVQFIQCGCQALSTRTHTIQMRSALSLAGFFRQLFFVRSRCLVWNRERLDNGNKNARASSIAMPWHKDTHRHRHTCAAHSERRATNDEQMGKMHISSLWLRVQYIFFMLTERYEREEKKK